MRVKTSDFWQAWKGVILFAFFQLVFHPLFWVAEKVGYESDNWDLMGWVLVPFAILIWLLPVVYGILSKEEKVRNGLWFFGFNTGFFFLIGYFVWYYVYTSRGMYPQW